MTLCTINGHPREIPDNATIAQLLAQLNLQGRKIAVEKNGAVIPKSQHNNTPLNNGDTLEIIGAVGGG